MESSNAEFEELLLYYLDKRIIQLEEKIVERSNTKLTFNLPCFKDRFC